MHLCLLAGRIYICTHTHIIQILLGIPSEMFWLFPQFEFPSCAIAIRPERSGHLILVFHFPQQLFLLHYIEVFLVVLPLQLHYGFWELLVVELQLLWVRVSRICSWVLESIFTQQKSDMLCSAQFQTSWLLRLNLMLLPHPPFFFTLTLYPIYKGLVLLSGPAFSLPPEHHVLLMTQCLRAE